MKKIDCFETDFIYTDVKTDEFKNVHIKLNVDGDDFLLDIFSDEELLKNEIEEILNQLNSAFFRRVRISLVDECRIVVRSKNKNKRIEIIDNGIVVKNIIPMEDK